MTAPMSLKPEEERRARLDAIRARRGTPERLARIAERQQAEEAAKAPRLRVRRPLDSWALDAAASRLVRKMEKQILASALDLDLDAETVAYDLFVSYAPTIERRPEVVARAKEMMF